MFVNSAAAKASPGNDTLTLTPAADTFSGLAGNVTSMAALETT
jgi:hypothetical protein